MTVEEAKKELKKIGITIKLNIKEGEKIDERETIIKEQVPVKGIKIYDGGEIFANI